MVTAAEEYSILHVYMDMLELPNSDVATRVTRLA